MIEMADNGGWKVTIATYSLGTPRSNKGATRDSMAIPLIEERRRCKSPLMAVCLSPDVTRAVNNNIRSGVDDASHVPENDVAYAYLNGVPPSNSSTYLCAELYDRSINTSESIMDTSSISSYNTEELHISVNSQTQNSESEPAVCSFKDDIETSKKLSCGYNLNNSCYDSHTLSAYSYNNKNISVSDFDCFSNNYATQFNIANSL